MNDDGFISPNIIIKLYGVQAVVHACFASRRFFVRMIGQLSP